MDVAGSPLFTARENPLRSRVWERWVGNKRVEQGEDWEDSGRREGLITSLSGPKSNPKKYAQMRRLSLAQLPAAMQPMGPAHPLSALSSLIQALRPFALPSLDKTKSQAQFRIVHGVANGKYLEHPAGRLLNAVSIPVCTAHVGL